jgi:hypothetical protein
MSDPIKTLIIVRAGRESLHGAFAEGCDAYADIAVSTFEDKDWSGPGVKYTHYARGGKFQGISAFLTQHPELIDHYDYFWLFEDDLLMPPETLAVAHNLLTRFRFVLAAPALTADSQVSWTLALRNERLLFRGTDFVEIMAPIMSNAFLRAALPYFSENFTGYGQEWLWRRILNEQNGFAAILDSAPVHRARRPETDTRDKNRTDGGDIVQDLDRFMRKFGLDPGAEFSNRFALTAEASPRFLTGDALLQEMSRGYAEMSTQNPGVFAWCLDELTSRFAPRETLADLRQLAGFDRIEAATRTQTRRAAHNLALRKPATQSSVSPSGAATPEQDAIHGNSGILAGDRAFQTAFEPNPWWQVDLQDVFEIAKIVVFARPGRQGCNLPLSVLSSLDGETWQLRAVKLDDMAFGDADSKPYHFELKEAVSARYIRVQFIGDGQLQLDEIEVFGAEETSPPPLPGRHLTTGALARLSDETHPALPRANINADGVLPRHRTAVVACARWETDYIEEWLTYYQCIGYGHVYLYCNDDDPAALYEKALPFTTGTSPFVTFIHFKGQGLQYAMYMHFIANYAAEVAWVSFFDVDEFLRIADGSRIDDFLTRFDDDVDCILFNWVVFGTSGHKTNPPGKVLENYTYRESIINPYTKLLCRASLLQDDRLKIPDLGFGFWHSLMNKLYRPVKVVNVLGSSERQEYYVGHEADRILNTAVLHHYLLRSEEAFQRRVARGTGGQFHGQAIWDPSRLSGETGLGLFNDIPDSSLANFWKDQAAKSRMMGVHPQGRGALLSRGRPCTQSSLSAWSRGATLAEDAGNAVNGQIDGTEKFHTDKDINPWWQIDLEAECRVNRIVIYNAAFHTSGRLRNFYLMISPDSNSWSEIYAKEDDLPVGSLATGPFVLDVSTPVAFRYLRLVMIGEDFLHLDQIEIYGDHC